MRCSVAAAASGIVLAAALSAVPKPSYADTIRYADGGFGSVSQSLSGLGYNLSNPSIESTAETFIVPGMTGGGTRLDFTYVGDPGSYQFSFGVFDGGAVTADPVSDRQSRAGQRWRSARRRLFSTTKTRTPERPGRWTLPPAPILAFFCPMSRVSNREGQVSQN